MMTVDASDLREFFEHLCRHLISISWFQGPVNAKGVFNRRPDYCTASAFLAQPRADMPDAIFLVTAGHVMNDYEFYEPKEGYAANGHSVCDMWGPRSEVMMPIPFNIFDETGYADYRKEEGLDYAFLFFPDYLARLLYQTTVPFIRDSWAPCPLEEFELFFMIGFPNDLVVQEIDESKKGGSVTTSHQPLPLILQPCDPPENSEFVPSDRPQFIAKIVAPNDIVDIGGMSGGPIVGIRKNHEGKWVYNLVAIQSRWIQKQKVVIGTLMSEIAKEIDGAFDAALASGELPSGET